MAVKPRKIPQRQCVGCREMKDKKELLRVVRTPEGEILLDGRDIREMTRADLRRIFGITHAPMRLHLRSSHKKSQ